MKKNWYFRLMLGLAILIIICGFVTVLNPSAFWRVMNILLGISLIFSGISAVINAVKNQQTPFISFLFAIGILIFILGIMLICAREANFVGKLMIWMFALWAFMRGVMLVFFGIQNRESQTFWRAIILLGGILVILAIVTAVSSARAANLAGICIGISIIFDGISMLYFAIKGSGAQTVQAQIITEASQNEIGQGDVIVSETVVITNNPDSQPDNQPENQ